MTARKPRLRLDDEQMTLRSLTACSSSSDADALDYEIAQEQAAALGRLGRALEAALAALAGYDRVQGEGREDLAALASSGTAVRARLVRDASYALWSFIIQREASGLRDERQIVRDYGVPGEVWSRMGAFGAD
jgi:hypothetical protein